MNRSENKRVPLAPLGYNRLFSPGYLKRYAAMQFTIRNLLILTISIGGATALLQLASQGKGFWEIVLIDLPMYSSILMAWTVFCVRMDRIPRIVQHIATAVPAIFAINLYATWLSWLDFLTYQTETPSSALAFFIRVGRLVALPIGQVENAIQPNPPLTTFVSILVVSLVQGALIGFGTCQLGRSRRITNR